MSHPLLRGLAPLLAMVGLMAAPSGCAPEGETLDTDATFPPTDLDGDGSLSRDDCDDEDDTVYPGAPEDPASDGLGDGLDNDCDLAIDEGTLDGDDDFDGYTEREGDCDDTSPVIAPALVDGCDSVNNDCDNAVDEDAADAHEPNNDRALATPVADDLTCDFRNVYLNLLGTSSSPDVDWLRFSVDNASSPGCAFGVTATLNGMPLGESIRMRLYRGSSTSAVETTNYTATVDGDSAVLQWVGNRNDQGGLFYLEVTAPSGSAACLDDMRLVVQGMAPPIIELP